MAKRNRRNQPQRDNKVVTPIKTMAIMEEINKTKLKMDKARRKIKQQMMQSRAGFVTKKVIPKLTADLE